ncbi:MAG: patatin-like phospholipase family protein [Kiritimatiellia bacterium]
MRLGLALGGGGARGLAHLGVVQRLQELDIPIDCVSGTSIGAIAAGIMASGNLPAALAWCAEPDWRKLPRLFVDGHLTNKALVRGGKIERLLAKLITARDFADFSIPCAMVATDLRTGEEIDIRSGDVLSAVRASMSIPGVFRPVERDGRVLVDGGLVNPLPVGVCRALGATKVIAVDITPRAESMPRKSFREMNIFDVLVETFRVFNGEMTRRVLADAPADVLLHPVVDDVKTLDFRNAQRLVEVGRQAVDARLADIVASIEWQP